MIYWATVLKEAPMVATSLRVSLFLILTGGFCAAFQRDGPLMARERHDAIPAADLRVDVPLALIPVHA